MELYREVSYEKGNNMFWISLVRNWIVWNDSYSDFCFNTLRFILKMLRQKKEIKKIMNGICILSNKKW